MTTVVMKIKSRNVIGIKETLAEYCEKFGDVVFVEVKCDDESEQLRMRDCHGNK